MAQQRSPFMSKKRVTLEDGDADDILPAVHARGTGNASNATPEDVLIEQEPAYVPRWYTLKTSHSSTRNNLRLSGTGAQVASGSVAPSLSRRSSTMNSRASNRRDSRATGGILSALMKQSPSEDSVISRTAAGTWDQQLVS